MNSFYILDWIFSQWFMVACAMVMSTVILGIIDRRIEPVFLGATLAIVSPVVASGIILKWFV